MGPFITHSDQWTGMEERTVEFFVYSRWHHCTLCSGCFCPLPPRRPQ